MAKIGKNIRTLRIEKNMTQNDLAALLFVSRQTVSNYENGKSNPDIDTLVKIAEIMECDVNALIYGIPVPPDRKKEYVHTAILTAITLLLGILLYVAAEKSSYYDSRYYLGLHFLLRTSLFPCYFVLLGWTFMQVTGVLFGAKGLTGKLRRQIRILTLAVLIVFVVLLLPQTIARVIYSIKVIHLHSTKQEFSTNFDFSFFPAFDLFIMKLQMFLYRFYLLFFLPGIALWITKSPKRNPRGK